jgi:hypothetical protein
MLIAKMSPGTVNAPYVTDMNTVPVPSMTYSVNRTYASIVDLSDAGNLNKPGTRTYTVFLSCPVVSQTLKYTPVPDKASGFAISMIDDPNDPAFTYVNFTQASYSLQNMLGSDPADFS